jgi:hypothetical protein
MGHEWIIDVIVDLQRYARTHELSGLEKYLEGASTSAKVEISRIIGNTFLSSQGEHSGTQQLSASVGTSGSA